MKPRNQFIYIGIALALIALGLFWRSDLLEIAPVLKKYGGSALWAAMVFSVIAVLRPRWSTVQVALCAAAFATAIELTQLYHPPWLDALRATLPGRLVLGSTFNWPDIPAYLTGIMAIAGAEQLVRGRSKCTSTPADSPIL